MEFESPHFALQAACRGKAAARHSSVSAVLIAHGLAPSFAVAARLLPEEPVAES